MSTDDTGKRRKIMFSIKVELDSREQELADIAELVRQAHWRAATSNDHGVAQQSNRTDAIVTTVDFNAVYPNSAYDATGLTLYWLVYHLVGQKDDADAVMNYIADGITIMEALEALGRTKV